MLALIMLSKILSRANLRELELVAGDNTGISSIGLLEALPLIIPALRIQANVRKFLKSNPPDIVVCLSDSSCFLM